MNQILNTHLLFIALRVMTPILFTAIGGLFASKAGVFNVALEGCMLLASFVGVAISYSTGNLILAVFTGILSSVILALIVVFFIIELNANLVIAGLAANILVSGLTAFMMHTIYGEAVTIDPINLAVLPIIDNPVLANIPIIGQILNNQVISVYFALLLIPVVIFIFNYTKFGFHIRVVGENLEAARAAGLKWKRIQYLSWVISGILCGLGGVSLSIGYVGLFYRDITAGRGWIAMAALSLGRGQPLGTFLSVLLFALADAIATQLQVTINIPNQFVLMVPYVITIIALVASTRKKTIKKEIQEQ